MEPSASRGQHTISTRPLQGQTTLILEEVSGQAPCLWLHDTEWKLANRLVNAVGWSSDEVTALVIPAKLLQCIQCMYVGPYIRTLYPIIP